MTFHFRVKAVFDVTLVSASLYNVTPLGWQSPWGVVGARRGVGKAGPPRWVVQAICEWVQLAGVGAEVPWEHVWKQGPRMAACHGASTGEGAGREAELASLAALGASPGLRGVQTSVPWCLSVPKEPWLLLRRALHHLGV